MAIIFFFPFILSFPFLVTTSGNNSAMSFFPSLKTKMKHQTKQINNNKQDMAFRFFFYKVVSFALTTQGQVTSHPVIHFSRPKNSVA